MNPYNNYITDYQHNNDRFFPIGVFGLGALTGGVAVAAFNPYRPRPFYPTYYRPPFPPYYY